MNKNLRRSVVALATAFASLALMSNPASANATHNATITGGTINIVRTDTTTETIPLGGTSTCASSIVISHTATSPDSVNVTTFTSEGRFQLSTSTNFYIAVLTRTASTAGTITGTSVSGVGLTLTADIYAASNTTDCAHVTTRSCRFANVGLTFSGTVSGTPLATGTTATLSSTSATLAVSPPCISLFTSLAGGTVTVNGMTLALTT